MLIGWAVVGWCGTGLPRPKPPGPNPWKPILGIIGGIAGGFAFHLMFNVKGTLTNLDFAVTCIGAFAVGFIVNDIVNLYFRDWNNVNRP
jgi:uncharacterized membrane protein YeaQ/YmgE (transglycosylase-associated protein family)